MSRSDILKGTIQNLEKLSEKQLMEAAHYIEYLTKKFEETILEKGIAKLTEESESFQFLAEEQEIYTKSDLKERYK
jgi:hypothetical protein